MSTVYLSQEMIEIAFRSTTKPIEVSQEIVEIGYHQLAKSVTASQLIVEIGYVLEPAGSSSVFGPQLQMMS